MSPDAPAGVHPLAWLVIFLLVGPPALLSKAGARLPGVFGAAGRWWQNREPAAASYRVSQAEITRIQTDYKRLSSDYDDLTMRIEKQDERIERQDERIERTEAELTKEKQRTWAAIGFIRRLIDSHQRHAPDAPIPEPPEVLRDIV